jgi:hypothetical protein
MKGAGRERRLRLEKTLSLTARWQFTTAISTAKEQVKGEKKREKKRTELTMGCGKPVELSQRHLLT